MPFVIKGLAQVIQIKAFWGIGIWKCIINTIEALIDEQHLVNNTKKDNTSGDQAFTPRIGVFNYFYCKFVVLYAIPSGFIYFGIILASYCVFYNNWFVPGPVMRDQYLLRACGTNTSS